jgi:hypothetical protein
MDNKEITDYRLLYAYEDQISEAVLRYINSKQGWQPYGSPFKVDANTHYTDDDDVRHTLVGQAMVKYK